MTGRLFALERWAERSPRVRYPLLLLAILLLVGLAGGLQGCGGTDDEPAPRCHVPSERGDPQQGPCPAPLQAEAQS